MHGCFKGVCWARLAGSGETLAVFVWCRGRSMGWAGTFVSEPDDPIWLDVWFHGRIFCLVGIIVQVMGLWSALDKEAVFSVVVSRFDMCFILVDGYRMRPFGGEVRLTVGQEARKSILSNAPAAAHRWPRFFALNLTAVSLDHSAIHALQKPFKPHKISRWCLQNRGFRSRSSLFDHLGWSNLWLLDRIEIID